MSPHHTVSALADRPSMCGSRLRTLRTSGWLVVVVAVIASSPLVAGAAQRSDLADHERATIELFRSASPSVVYITTLQNRRDVFSRNVYQIPRGAGSGFVWDRKGHIVTNDHVVAGGQSFRVTLDDQSTWEARLVGEAPEKDLAVLRIEAPREALEPLPLGSSDDLLVGQSAYAIGNPFGLDHTLTTGVISALGREIESLIRRPIRDVIQTDAAINPGNSGGPLLDSSGRLIGVNTQIYSPSGGSAGIGFAIPVDTVRWVIPDLVAYGRIQRPVLGVDLADAGLLRRLRLEGALVMYVAPGSGADRAGLQATRQSRTGIVLGDLIVAVGDQPVRSSNDLFLATERYEIGDTVKVTFVRQGERITASVRLGSLENLR